MKRVGAFATVTILAAVTLALASSGRRGISARPAAAGYAVHGEAGTAAVGARLLTAKEIHRAFVTDVSRCCLVVETGLFPKAGRSVAVSSDDFTLESVATGATFAPEDPKVVAYALKKAIASQKQISLYPTAGVSYEAGGIDPFGQRLPGGVYRSVGIGVGVGKAGAPSRADAATMETELAEKSLPKGTFTAPVAGYLYFRVAADKGPYTLLFHAGAKTLSLPLP